MRLLSFRLPAGPPGTRFGALLSGERVLDLSTVYPTALAFLESGAPGESTVRDAILRAEAGETLAGPIRPLDAVELRPPVPQARKLIALAGNYVEHNREQGRAAVGREGTFPHLFMKPPSTTLIGSGEPFRVPSVARKLDYEGELAVVIGRRCRAVSAREAAAVIAGYTALNDLTDRGLQPVDGPVIPRERDPFFNWLVGKWFDGSAPCGPWLVSADEIPDPHTLRIRTRVNGELRQDGTTADMVFRVPEIVEFVSRFLTLEPGDLIATGTPSGVGHPRGLYLRPGDRVEVEIQGIGMLVTPIAGPEDAA